MKKIEEPIENSSNEEMKQRAFHRGEIFYIDIMDGIGSEQQGRRPAIIISNDKGNEFAPTITVAFITTSLKRPDLPMHVLLNRNCGLHRSSMVLCEQIRTIAKERVLNYVGKADEPTLEKIGKAIKVQFSLF